MVRSVNSRHSLMLIGMIGCLPIVSADTPPPEWAYNSVPTVWTGPRTAERQWTNSDGLPQQLELRRRSDGTTFYVHHAVTAVCGDAGKQASCKLHHFLGYYDDIGRFLGYRVPTATPFTKNEHKPFKAPDYAHLDRILRDPDHSLGTLSSIRDNVDAVTGATARYIADRTVPGAFYTSYTIWQLVHRTLPDLVQRWTLERVDRDLLRQWLHRGETLKAWWFFDRAEDSPLPEATRHDLAYEFLACRQPTVQKAALRYLERCSAPFRPQQALATSYPILDESVKVEVLKWWTRHGYAPPEAEKALRDDLLDRSARASPLTVPLLAHLAGTGPPTGTAWRAALEAVIRNSPSTYIRRKAAALLQATPGPGAVGHR